MVWGQAQVHAPLSSDLLLVVLPLPLFFDSLLDGLAVYGPLCDLALFLGPSVIWINIVCIRSGLDEMNRELFQPTFYNGQVSYL